MLTFLLAGGFSMIIVLLFGGVCLFGAGRYAWRGRPKDRALAADLSQATVFAVVSGVAGNLISVAWKVPANEEWAHSPDVHLIIMSGIGEALTPAVMGFTMLALSWALLAVGARRHELV